MIPAIGTRVRIERDEALYPPKGTWRQFAGKVGTVVEINHDRKRPHLTEYGVQFGKVRAPHSRTGSIVSGTEATTWFKVHELTATRGLASERAEGSRRAPSPMGDTGEHALTEEPAA